MPGASFTPAQYDLTRTFFIPASGGDDTATLMQAHNALPATGGKIQLGPGQYSVQLNQVVFTKSIILEGAGPRATWVRNLAPGNGWLVQFRTANENNYPLEASPHGWVWQRAARSAVRDIAFYYEDYVTPIPFGTVTSTPNTILTTPPTSGGGVFVEETNWMGIQFLASNCYFGRLWEGIAFERQLASTVENCVFWECYKSGFRMSNAYHSDQGDNHVRGCSFFFRNNITGVASDLSCVRWNGGAALYLTDNKLWQGIFGLNVDFNLTVAPTYGNVAPSILVLTGGSIEQQAVNSTTTAAIQLKSLYGKGGAGSSIGANRLFQAYLNPGHMNNNTSLVVDGGVGAFKDITLTFGAAWDGPVVVRDAVDRLLIKNVVTRRVNGGPTKFVSCTFPSRVTSSYIGSECVLEGWTDPSDIPVSSGLAAVPWNPADVSGLIATIDPAQARARNMIWQDTGKTTLATANGHTVRVIRCPRTGLEWTTPSGALTLVAVGDTWRLRTPGSAYLQLTRSTDLTQAWAVTQFMMTTQRADCTVHLSTDIGGGATYGFLGAAGATPGDAFYLGNTSGGQSRQATRINIPFTTLVGMNGASSYVEVNGVRVHNTTHSGGVASGWSVGGTGISGMAIYSLIGDIGFHALYSGVPTAAARDEANRYTYTGWGFIRPDTLVVAHGNSLTRGYQQTAGTSYPMIAWSALGTSRTVMSYGTTGIQTPDMTTAVPTVHALVTSSPGTFARKRVVVWEGVNHLSAGGATGQQARDALAACCQAWTTLGYEVLLIDVMAANHSGQPGGFQAARTSCNSLLAADFTVATTDPYTFAPASGVPYARRLLKVSAIPALQNPSDGVNFQADLLHSTAAGALVVGNQVAASLGTM